MKSCSYSLLTALALVLSALTADAQVLYRQNFGNNLAPSGTADSVAWQLFNSTAAADISGDAGFFGNASNPNNVANVNSSVNPTAAFGHAISTMGATAGISLLIANSAEVSTFSSVVNLDPANYSTLTFSWYGISETANIFQRLAVQIDGSWYATDTAFQPSIGGTLTQVSFNFDVTASLWRDVTFTPGSILSLSQTARTLDLPSGIVQNFGILSTNIGPSIRTSRIDTFEITGIAIPEPSAIGSLAFAMVAGAVWAVRRRRG